MEQVECKNCGCSHLDNPQTTTGNGRTRSGQRRTYTKIIGTCRHCGERVQSITWDETQNLTTDGETGINT